MIILYGSNQLQRATALNENKQTKLFRTIQNRLDLGLFTPCKEEQVILNEKEH